MVKELIFDMYETLITHYVSRCISESRSQKI